MNFGIDLKEVVKFLFGEDMNDWIVVYGGFYKLKFMGFNRIIRNILWYYININWNFFLFLFEVVVYLYN